MTLSVIKILSITEFIVNKKNHRNTNICGISLTIPQMANLVATLALLLSLVKGQMRPKQNVTEWGAKGEFVKF